jgi:valyl-tRNA synthetase
VVRDGRVRFVPDRWGRVYLDWMENLRPWCISRQLWWGHQLPVWYCDGCQQTIVQETPPDGCPACGSSLRRETDVLDTWFSSALWPFVTWGWPDETPDLACFYPTAVLSTAREILFLWVARMVMMGLEFAGDIPFKDVYIHSVVQAPDGRRMSKSLGTGIDPLDLIDQYGADATRFGLLLMSSIQDVRFSEEKIQMGRNFANKLWNASRLVLLAAETAGGVAAQRSDAHVVDRWITARLARAVEQTQAALAGYEFSAAIDGLYHFVWDELCDWYLEMVKVRLYGDDAAAAGVAAGHACWVLDGVLRLLHPLLPFVTDEIADLYGAAPLLRTRLQPVAAPLTATQDAVAVATLQGAVDALRRYRADRKVAPGERLTVLVTADDGAHERLYGERAAEVSALARVDLRFTEDRHMAIGDGATQAGMRAVADGDVVMVPGATFAVLVAAADRDAERARLRAQLPKLEGEVARAQARLANEQFVGRAPESVVQKEREKLAAYETDRNEVAARLAELG